MSIAIPYWPFRRLVLSAHTVHLMGRGVAIHSNVEKGKTAENGPHVLMVDFDKKNYPDWDNEDVFTHLESFSMPFFVYRTESGGWHAIIPIKFSFREMTMLQCEIGDDIDHVRMSCRFGRAALTIHRLTWFHIGGDFERDDLAIDHYNFYLHYLKTVGGIDPKYLFKLTFRKFRKQKFEREII